MKFIDSARIFSVSLNSLCDVFNQGEGKTSAYNSKFNSLSIFLDLKLLSQFKSYAYNDALVLFKCMLNATKLYKEEYDVDLSKNVSMFSLSMLIFRKKNT